MSDDIAYPTTEDVLAIHEAIVASDRETEPGVRSRQAVHSALVYVSEGYFGEVPETIHETAARLMRLLAAEHPFVDGNKRTALNATALLYDLNGTSSGTTTTSGGFCDSSPPTRQESTCPVSSATAGRTPSPPEAKHRRLPPPYPHHGGPQ